MIGQWQRFGEGEPPADGEAVVFIRDRGLSDLAEGLSGGEAIVTIYRPIYRHGLPYGALWTSLPPLRGPEPAT